MEREQFTFYSSFARAVKRIRKAADRAAAYDAIIDYAIYGEEPNLEKLPETAAIAFELVRPNLDASRRKAENGVKGGKKANRKQDESKAEAAASYGEKNKKQTGSKPEANESKPEANGEQEQEQEQAANKKEKENEIEVEIEGEKENECYISLPEKEQKESPSLFPGEKKQTESKGGDPAERELDEKREAEYRKQEEDMTARLRAVNQRYAQKFGGARL